MEEHRSLILDAFTIAIFVVFNVAMVLKGQWRIALAFTSGAGLACSFFIPRDEPVRKIFPIMRERRNQWRK